MHPRLYGQPAFQFLVDYAPNEFISYSAHESLPPEDVLQMYLQGSTLALALCRWAQLLRWPVGMTPDYLQDNDWGITWVELYFSFLWATGVHIPIKVSGTAYTTRMIDFTLPEAMLLPHSKRSLASQTTCFQRSLSALNHLTGQKWFPHFNSGRVTSLKHLGWSVQATGIPCRPILPCQYDAMRAVYKIATGQVHKINADCRIIPFLQTNNPCWLSSLCRRYQ